MPAHRASAQLHNTLRDALATGALPSPIWTWDVSSFARSRTLNWVRGRGGDARKTLFLCLGLACCLLLSLEMEMLTPARTPARPLEPIDT